MMYMMMNDLESVIRYLCYLHVMITYFLRIRRYYAMRLRDK